MRNSSESRSSIRAQGDHLRPFSACITASFSLCLILLPSFPFDGVETERPPSELPVCRSPLQCLPSREVCEKTCILIGTCNVLTKDRLSGLIPFWTEFSPGAYRPVQLYHVQLSCCAQLRVMLPAQLIYNIDLGFLSLRLPPKHLQPTSCFSSAGIC